MIEKYVWIFPYVILTNDPTPPSSELKGVTLKQFAVVATASVLLPGVVVESDSLIAAGATVIKNVEQFEVVGGNPAKKIADIRTIRNHNTGELVYPWRYTYDKYMPWEGIGYEKWSDEKTDLT